MKRICLFIFFFAIYFVYPAAQTTIQITFTAETNGSHIPLDSIIIGNLSKGGDTTLYGTDTMLVLDHGTGIEDLTANHCRQMVLFPAYPNPVTHASTIRLWLSQDAPVTLSLIDLQGRELVALHKTLGFGYHDFRIGPAQPAICFLVAESMGLRQVQKMIGTSPGNGAYDISYAGHPHHMEGFRKVKSSFPWDPGDNLRFLGFTSLGIDTIDDYPAQSAQYTFQFSSSAMPPSADFSASDTTTQINITVNFTDLTIGSPATWKWHFGDGDSSIVQNPSHIYTAIGLYSVILIVSNPDGSDTLTKHNYITVGSAGPGNPCPGLPQAMDINGNVYNTVQIGTQCWIKENLRARNYRNGSAIPNITDGTIWVYQTTGARCWYNNDSATYAATYGALYNWYAVDNSNGICPTSWHVPTDLEWQTLEMHLGMTQSQANSSGWRGTDEGEKMKEAGLAHWGSPNTGATNSSGFTALPGGSRNYHTGNFDYVGSLGDWWSSTADSTMSVWKRKLYSNYSNVGRYNNSKEYGFSVRCVRD